MEFISIGPYCAAADILKQNCLRNQAYPFDYIFSSLEMVMHCINDKFQIFLDKNTINNDHNKQHNICFTVILLTRKYLKSITLLITCPK